VGEHLRQWVINDLGGEHLRQWGTLAPVG